MKLGHRHGFERGVPSTGNRDIAEVLRALGGDAQRSAALASFLAFQPITSPEDLLAGPLHGGLKWFFAQRWDNFGLRELYRVGAHGAKPGSVGLYVAALTECGLRFTNLDACAGA